MPTHEIEIVKPAGLLARHAWQGFIFGYGTITLGAFLLLAFTSKSSFRRLSDKSRRELAIARDKLWNLKKQPNGLNHRFCILRDGIKLHYVEALPNSNLSSTTSLVIFIHGFPDSWALWQHYLNNGKLQANSVMVAVDLPGFGGSDSLQSYGPDDVMETMTEFILKMREQYITEDKPTGRVLIVAHDWGALVGFRLASEAPQLADRFILSNSFNPALAMSNIQSRVASASQMFHTWIHQPLNFKLLRQAISNVFPLLKQVMKSGYAFVFNLPRPMANLLGNTGDFWFLRYLNAISAHPSPSKPLEGEHGAEMLASSIGPSMEQCITNKSEELAYSESVRERAQTGGWFEKLRVYREDLAFSPWEKSLETLWALSQIRQVKGRRRSSSGVGLFDDGPAGSLKAATTVIWGKGDVAIENSIAIEGMRDFFGTKSSQLVIISRCGHWVPVEKQGIPVFEEVLEWSITGEKGSLKDRLSDNFPLANIMCER